MRAKSGAASLVELLTRKKTQTALRRRYCGAWIFASAFFHEFLLTNFAGDELIQGTDFDSSTPSERCRRALTSQ